MYSFVVAHNTGPNNSIWTLTVSKVPQAYSNSGWRSVDNSYLKLQSVNSVAKQSAITFTESNYQFPGWHSPRFLCYFACLQHVSMPNITVPDYQREKGFPELIHFPSERRSYPPFSFCSFNRTMLFNHCFHAASSCCSIHERKQLSSKQKKLT